MAEAVQSMPQHQSPLEQGQRQEELTKAETDDQEKIIQAAEDSRTAVRTRCKSGPRSRPLGSPRTRGWACLPRASRTSTRRRCLQDLEGPGQARRAEVKVQDVQLHKFRLPRQLQDLGSHCHAGDAATAKEA
ncbi:unnamed protein product [Prorocentrum cordatum]|uniref:Uncharacterized protein n=1 Tax=Prorocentrum cordatum TaxID=2364126 RepID=A0ABN9U0Q6_9DINO|nr:unnamed protein product [Polarella glacialis]